MAKKTKAGQAKAPVAGHVGVKPFLRMSAAEREAEVARLGSGVSFDETRPLSPKGQLLWRRAKRGRPRKPEAEKAARVLITLPPELLAKADALATLRKQSRSELIAEGLRAVLTGAGRD